MKIETEKDKTSLLSLFLFPIQEYETITAHILLPAPNDYSSISDPRGLRDSAIENLQCVCMMLRRKYYSVGEGVQLCWYPLTAAFVACSESGDLSEARETWGSAWCEIGFTRSDSFLMDLLPIRLYRCRLLRCRLNCPLRQHQPALRCFLDADLLPL